MKNHALLLLLTYAAVHFSWGTQASTDHMESAKSVGSNIAAASRLDFRLTSNGPRWLLQLMIAGPEKRLILATVIDTQSGKTLQRLPMNLPFDEYSDTDSSSVFHDINFDGYTDVVLFSNSYAGSNTSSSVWLFNPETRKFEFNPDLSRLTKLTVDPAKKTASTSNSCCAGLSSTSETYRWKGKKLELIERLTQEPLDPQPNLPAPNNCTDPIWVSQTTEKLVEGKMQKVKIERIPMSG